MSDGLFRYKGYAIAETPGSDRDDAIRRAFAFMDAHSKRRRTKATDRYEVFRVRRLDRGWWAVYYRPKRRGVAA
jgi:hypothetical protein